MALVILHVLNQEPIVGEIDKLPDPKDTFIAITNPRKQDNKPIQMIQRGAKMVMFPWNQIFFVEVMESDEEKRGLPSIWRE